MSTPLSHHLGRKVVGCQLVAKEPMPEDRHWPEGLASAWQGRGRGAGGKVGISNIPGGKDPGAGREVSQQWGLQDCVPPPQPDCPP